jgi:aromatic ring-cleaving dioxygenase
MNPPPSATPQIRGCHAHVYYDPASTRAAAESLRLRIGERFAMQLGRWHDRPLGPRTAAMYQAAFDTPVLAQLVLPLSVDSRDETPIVVNTSPSRAP